jgi:hypothetical protein
MGHGVGSAAVWPVGENAAVRDWLLPDGLPDGRLIVTDPSYAEGPPVTDPVLWVTDAP